MPKKSQINKYSVLWIIYDDFIVGEQTSNFFPTIHLTVWFEAWYILQKIDF